MNVNNFIFTRDKEMVDVFSLSRSIIRRLGKGHRCLNEHLNTVGLVNNPISADRCEVESGEPSSSAHALPT